MRRRGLGFLSIWLVLGPGACLGRPPTERAGVAVAAPATSSRLPAAPVATASGSPLAAVAAARHLLGRCAFGARPGEAERVARLGTERWLDEQLAGPAESPLLEAALVPHRRAYVPPAQLVDDWLGDGWEHETQSLRQLGRATAPHYREHLQRLATAELTRDILSRRQLLAVMTNFWANHFNVYAAKGYVRLFEGDYLERALRPLALGRFSELLLATARHPAMLLYLDNADSRRARAGRGGLNENYARELLELHTLGVGAGYTQEDVQGVARILTGWSVVRLTSGRFEYQFKKAAHDKRAKTVLGQVFPAGGGEDEGVRLLEILARHPATARRLAQRLCAHFVADEPPATCVEAASHAYAASEGDLRQVVKAIVQHETFWAPSARGAKLKTPLELVASAARAFDAMPDGSLALAHVLGELGEPLLSERLPTGYPDSEPEWASAGGMLARMRFASNFGAGKVPGLSIDWQGLLPESDAASLVARLGALLFAGGGSPLTLELVRQELAPLVEPAERRAAAVALLVGSPEFQRQ